MVKGDEIAVKIKELMESEDLRVKAARIGEAAKKAAGAGGAREETLKRLVEEWRKKEV